METKACLSTVLVFATLLSACASQFPSSDRIADTEAVIEHHRDRIDRSNLKVGEAQPSRRMMPRPAQSSSKAPRDLALKSPV